MEDIEKRVEELRKFCDKNLIEGNEEAIEILKLRLQDMIELLQEGDDK